VDSKKKVARIIILGVIVVLIIGVAAAFAFGYLYAGIKSPEDRVSVSREDSSSGSGEYNSAAQFRPVEGTSDTVQDTETLNTLLAELQGNPDAVNDPTCQAMIFNIAFNTPDYDTAKEALDQMKRLHSQRLFPDMNLAGITQLPMYEATLRTINPDAGTSEFPDGRG
jgi:flagellar basal body-associated protein FliL